MESLEILLTEQERIIDQFGDLLRDQQSQIARLKQQIQSLEQKMSKYAESPEVSNEPETPPHY